MATEQTQEYDDALVAVLEAVWGEGYLSPGGPDEIRMILEGVPLAGKAVLDLGCGTGGITRFLADSYGPALIVGIDVDAGLVARATERAARAGVANGPTFQTVTPGPLPFADGSFDVVFSKDAMVHIADKEALFGEVFRVLRPGGWVAASDWMSSTVAPFSSEMTLVVASRNVPSRSFISTRLVPKSQASRRSGQPSPSTSAKFGVKLRS